MRRMVNQVRVSAYVSGNPAFAEAVQRDRHAYPGVINSEYLHIQIAWPSSVYKNVFLHNRKIVEGAGPIDFKRFNRL